MVVRALVLAACLFWPATANAKIEAFLKPSVKRIEKVTFTDVLSQHHMAAIYFYKSDVPHVPLLLNELGAAATKLTEYGIAVGINDCTNLGDAVPEFCSFEKAHAALFIFRNGSFFVSVGIEALFDKSSIISNLLQLRLIDEVLIAQTELDLLNIEQSALRKYVLHGLFLGVGTSEHGAFMQVAYDYKDDPRLRFIYGTDFAALGHLGRRLGMDINRTEVDSAGRAVVIVTQYEDTSTADTAVQPKLVPVASHIYRGVMEYSSFRSFVRALDQPDAVDLGSNPEPMALLSSLADRHALVAIYDDAVSSDVEEVVRRLTQKFYKTFVALLVHKKAAHHVSKYVHQDASESAILPIYCMVPRQKQICEQLITGAHADGAVQQLEPLVSALLEQQRSQLSNTMDYKASSASNDAFDAETELIRAVETQDDPVAIYAREYKQGNVELRGNVQVLGRDTFADFVRGQSGRIVLFHLKKFDPTSTLALSALSEAQSRLQDMGFASKFGAVDCFDWTDVCANASVYKYPSVLAYRLGVPSLPLAVPVSVQGFVTAGKLASRDNPVYLDTVEKIEEFTAEMVFVKEQLVASSTTREHHLIVLSLFHNRTETAELTTFSHVAAFHEGTAAIYVAFGSQAQMLLARYGDVNIPLPTMIAVGTDSARTYRGDMSNREEIERFLAAAALPALALLTPSSFPALRAGRLPIVILFADEAADASEAFTAVRKAAGSTLAQFFSFTYMLRHSYGAQIILSQYWPERTHLPALTVVDFIQGNVYCYNNSSTTAESFQTSDVRAWLDSILAGTAKAQLQLPAKQWLPAHPGYDYHALASAGPTQLDHDRLSSPHHQNQQERERMQRSSSHMFGGTAQPAAAFVRQNSAKVAHTEL